MGYGTYVSGVNFRVPVIGMYKMVARSSRLYGFEMVALMKKRTDDAILLIKKVASRHYNIL